MPSTRKSSHLDRILGRVDDLDSVNLTILVQRLARERALLETVFNTIQEGVLVVDENGIVEYANAPACSLIGLKATEVGSALLWKIVPDVARSLNFTPDGPAQVLPAAAREFEITYPERRFVRLYLVPLENVDEGVSTRFAMILSDISEQKASTEELIENERISSIFELAAGVAHELGNPLNGLTIHLQLITRQLSKLEYTPQLDKISDALRVCQSEVERLDGIITHFLDAIRPAQADLQEIELLDVLTDVLEFQREEIENLGIEVMLETKEALPLILGDRNQLKQVFFNVTKNAMESMNNGGYLRVSGRSDDEWVYIYVADTGVGISQEDLAKIFQPYYTSKDAGHGLGMLIVRRILREHGGQIGIDSQPGTGTLVTLQFPLKSRRVRLLEAGADEVATP